MKTQAQGLRSCWQWRGASESRCSLCLGGLISQKLPSPSPSTPQVGLTTHWLIYLFDLFLFFSWILDCLFICYFWSLLLRRGFEVGATCSKRGFLSRCSVRAPHCGALSCCEAWALEHAGLSCDAPALLPRSMWDLPGPGGRTCVPCIGKWTLRHWTTEEVPSVCSWKRYC